MKKLLIITLLLLIRLCSFSLASNIELEEMNSIIEKQCKNAAKNQTELFERYLNLSNRVTTSLQEKVEKLLVENQIIITALTRKSDSLKAAESDLATILNNNEGLTKDLHVSKGNCRLFLNDGDKQYSIVFSTPALRALNFREKYGCYCKPIDNETEKKIDSEISKVDTFQHVSRFIRYELFQKVKMDKNLSLVYTPITYLIKLPWSNEYRIADDTSVILQECIANINPVDEAFISSLNYEQVRQMYEIIKGVGIWNLKNNWYVDNDGKMYILEMQQQSKTSPDNSVEPKDPTLDIREGIKALASYFPLESEQFKYLISVIQNDEDLIFSKPFMNTLINKAYEAHNLNN